MFTPIKGCKNEKRVYEEFFVNVVNVCNIHGQSDNDNGKYYKYVCISKYRVVQKSRPLSWVIIKSY